MNAQYSDGGYSRPDANGHKRMYRCLVLTGDYCNGTGGMRMPPQKPGQPSHVLYDSLTNNTGSPIMFIVFNDCQAYPEHLITYIGLFQKKITFLVRKFQKFCVWPLTLYAFIICQVIIRTQFYTNASLISAPVVILYQNVRGD